MLVKLPQILLLNRLNDNQKYPLPCRETNHEVWAFTVRRPSFIVPVRAPAEAASTADKAMVEHDPIFREMCPANLFGYRYVTNGTAEMAMNHVFR